MDGRLLREPMKAGTRTPCSIGYFAASALAATAACGPVSSSAVASRWGPVTLPRAVHGAIHTCGKFRMRLAVAGRRSCAEIGAPIRA
jgi:hypothetical protein